MLRRRAIQPRWQGAGAPAPYTGLRRDTVPRTTATARDRAALCRAIQCGVEIRTRRGHREWLRNRGARTKRASRMRGKGHLPAAATVRDRRKNRTRSSVAATLPEFGTKCASSATQTTRRLYLSRAQGWELRSEPSRPTASASRSKKSGRGESRVDA